MMAHGRRRSCHNYALLKFFLEYFSRLLLDYNNFLVFNLLLMSLDKIRLLSLTLGHLLVEKVTFLRHTRFAAFMLLLISQLLPQFNHFVPVLAISEYSKRGDSLHVDH